MDELDRSIPGESSSGMKWGWIYADPGAFLH